MTTIETLERRLKKHTSKKIFLTQYQVEELSDEDQLHAVVTGKAGMHYLSDLALRSATQLA